MHSLRRALHRWRVRARKAQAFSLLDWRLFAEATLTLATVQLTMFVVPFPRLVAWVKRPGSGPPIATERIERITWMVSATARMWHLKCLAHSLALARMLGRRGVATDIRLGVRTENGKLLAHAWIEWMGHALNDTEQALEPFARFDRSVGDTSHV